MALLLGLGGTAVWTDDVDAAERRLHDAARDAAAALRPVVGDAGVTAAARELGTQVGQRRPVRAKLVRRVGDPPELAVYAAALAAHDDAVARFDAQHQERVDAARADVLRLFRDDPRLRDVLLLSNDDRYDLFTSWARDADDPGWTAKRRRRADLFTMYLQRVTTKNETNAHFGPVSVGTLTDGAVLSWTDGAAERPTARFSHWAAQAIGRALADRPSLWPHVRPRRLPLALPTADGTAVVLHESTTATGLTADWTFTRHPARPLTATERWVFERADGRTPLRALHAERCGAAEDLDAAVRALRADRVLAAQFEIPVGELDPLGALAALLPDDPATASTVADLAALRALVPAFSTAAHDERVRLLGEIKTRFTALSGHEPTRFAGRHYADRGVLHEETLSEVSDVRAGAWLRDFVTDELSVVYDLLLLGPRHRARRETALLADWFAGRFGSGAQVSLERFYDAWFADRDAVAERVRDVDAEIAALDRDLVALLAGDAPADAREVEVDRAALQRFLDGRPATPRAVCNPDLMIAAGGRDDLVEGRFRAVVGDCHAMRELLTHTSVAPLIADRHPAVAEEITELYRGLLDDGEVLADVMRTHLDKTDAQLELPMPDVEFLGRSPKDPDRVVPASELRLSHDGHRLHLVAAGRPGRLRLLAPPATGPSIVRDPLAVFAFPRHFGGVAIRGGDAAHLPRFRCGRVVLQRELWRVDCAELTGETESAAHRVATRLRDRLGLPRFVFAKHPGEPKPVFVDFESPLLVAQLTRLARGRTGTVLISEMLPAPDELWLAPGGRPRTSEVRCAVFG